MTSREIRVNRIMKYNVSCGSSESAAREYAERMIERGESISVIGKYTDDFGRTDYFLIDNFTCPAEVYGWTKFDEAAFVSELVDKMMTDGRVDLESYCGNVDYAKRLSKSRYSRVILEANDPFYNSIWGQIDADVVAKCCAPVRARIAKGM